MTTDSPPPPPSQAPATSEPRKSKTWLWWLLVLIPAGLVGLLLLVVAVGFLFVYSGQEQPVTDEDRAVIVDIRRLAEWMEDYRPRQGVETITKTRYIDGSHDLEYEYDIPDDPDAPYLNCSVTVERNVSDAITTYVAFWGGSQLGLSLLSDVEIEVVERDDLFQWGDQSRFVILQAEGRPFGNAFIGRSGKSVVFVMFSGVYFDEGEWVRDLLDEPLGRLSFYEP